MRTKTVLFWSLESPPYFGDQKMFRRAFLEVTAACFGGPCDMLPGISSACFLFSRSVFLSYPQQSFGTGLQREPRQISGVAATGCNNLPGRFESLG